MEERWGETAGEAGKRNEKEEEREETERMRERESARAHTCKEWGVRRRREGWTEGKRMRLGERQA